MNKSKHIPPVVEVDETADYVNCLDLLEDNETSHTKTSFSVLFDEDNEDSCLEVPKISAEKHVWKSISIHFRNIHDLNSFAVMLNQTIFDNTKYIWFPKIVTTSLSALFDDSDAIGYKISQTTKIKNDKSNNQESSNLFETADNESGNDHWTDHWNDMPSFIQEENGPWKTITVKLATEEDMAAFGEIIDQKLTAKTKSTWHPQRMITKNSLMRWFEIKNGEYAYTQPKYPLYIISKGRHETMYTARSLSRMRIHHHIAVEPQDWELYDAALDEFNIRNYATLLLLPFSNHGDGPGRARNWCWDHSMKVYNAKRHWVFDDNIQDFYRLHENQRIRVESGVMFTIMEDFCDRYENIKIAGPQYRFFCAADQKYPGYVKNTRIYSTLLIENDCKHRWRGRYNEDTDICLNVLKDEDCTVQFNIFLQGKAATQTVSGGNTQEFYHVENVEGEVKLGKYNVGGTVNKSLLLEKMHPDVAKMVWRYGRWHHHVDYSSFKDIKMRYVDGVEVASGENNYGLELQVFNNIDEVNDVTGVESMNGSDE